MKLDSKILSKSWFLGLVAALLTGLVFSPALKAEFVWDDTIVQVFHIPLHKTVKDAFVPPKGMFEFGAYFRPVVIISYMIDDAANNKLYGNPGANERIREDAKRATIPHASTVLIHMMATFATALLIHRCLKDRPWGIGGAWIGALMFALHPVHAESVTFIAGRSDSMATMFLVFAVVCAVKWRDGKSNLYLGLTVLLYFLGLMSKEVGIAGLVLIPAALFFVPTEDKNYDKRWWLPMAGCLATTGIFFLLRSSAGIYSQTVSSKPFGVAVTSLFQATGFYIKEIFYPWPPSPYIPYLPSGFMAAIAICLALLPILYACWKVYQKGSPLFLFGIVWFFAALTPSFYVVVNNVSETAVADRYLYLSSVGFCLIAGGLASLADKDKIKKIVAGCFGALFLVYAATSFNAASKWGTDLSLWQSLTEQKATSTYALPWVNLATRQLLKGDLENAEKNFKYALNVIKADDIEDFSLIYNGLGGIRFDKGLKAMSMGDMRGAYDTYKEAAFFYQKAASFGLADWTFTKNLAQTKLQMVFINKYLTGQLDRVLLEEAGRNIEIGLKISPNNNEILALKQKYLYYKNSP